MQCSGYAGGGASDVRRGGFKLIDRIWLPAAAAATAPTATSTDDVGGSGGKGGGSRPAQEAPAPGTEPQVAAAEAERKITAEPEAHGGCEAEVQVSSDPRARAATAARAVRRYPLVAPAAEAAAVAIMAAVAAALGRTTLPTITKPAAVVAAVRHIRPNAIKFRVWQGWKSKVPTGLVVFSWD